MDRPGHQDQAAGLALDPGLQDLELPQLQFRPVGVDGHDHVVFVEVVILQFRIDRGVIDHQGAGEAGQPALGRHILHVAAVAAHVLKEDAQLRPLLVRFAHQNLPQKLILVRRAAREQQHAQRLLHHLHRHRVEPVFLTHERLAVVLRHAGHELPLALEQLRLAGGILGVVLLLFVGLGGILLFVRVGLADRLEEFGR